ncbi:hypothetical protein ACE6H2_019508 [Prunus campanulata]
MFICVIWDYNIFIHYEFYPNSYLFLFSMILVLGFGPFDCLKSGFFVCLIWVAVACS